MLNVKVVHVGKKTTNNNFITKIVSEKKVIVVGIEKIAKITYYVALPSAPAVGSTHELDLDLFTIVERPFDLPNGEGTIMLKWLHIK